MNTQTIFMCVVALLIGMLVANMLQNVCGCKKVEGFRGGIPRSVPPSDDIEKINQFIVPNQENERGSPGFDENLGDPCGLWHNDPNAVKSSDAVAALRNYCSNGTVYKTQEEWSQGLQSLLKDNSTVFGPGECTARGDVDFDSSCISSGLSN